MRTPHGRGRSAGQRLALSRAPMALLWVTLLLALVGCGGPTSAWLTLPPLGAPDTIILSLAPDPARAGWLYAGSSQGDLYHVAATAERLPAPLSKLPTTGAIDTLLPEPANPNVLFATGTAGVFLSLDRGAHWLRRDNGLPPSDSALSLAWASDGRTLLAGTGAHGVFRSNDEGATWTAASVGLPEGADVYTLYRAPGSTIIFASVLEVGLYASLDNGAHWAVWPAVLDAQEIFAVLAQASSSSQNATPALYAGTSRGLFVSRDGGQIWTQNGYGHGLPAGRVISLAADIETPGALFAGTDQQVYRSSDGGVNWAALGPGIAHQVAALLVLHGAGDQLVVFAGAGNLYRFPRALPISRCGTAAACDSPSSARFVS